ncbi:hypothetical protein O181_124904 [Austropuccinia psidii MF-1]|uniref:Integrase catalytic domain-containing protein n=1 Tax=Austropuccinia psidii MF-1 TaxID=1389203 RepID=A0A9Q3KT13_9BASI|nr:hypothetical protein [Austropuccinia psidii MF-1]
MGSILPSLPKEKSKLQREQGKSTETSTIFERVSMDAVHIKSGRWKYMVVGRDDFSGWPETVGIVKLKAKAVSEWFTSEWICRYGSPKEVTVDGGPEFGNKLKDAVKKAGSRIRVTTPYYPESQRMVERGHKQIKDVLVKICGENGKNICLWLLLLTEFQQNKQLVSHHLNSNLDKYQYYQLTLKQKAFLAVEWDKKSTTEELLEARAKQLEGKEEMRRKAAEKLKKSREDSMKYWVRQMAHN